MTRRSVIVSGMIAADPWQGGATWAILQYVLGLSRLGHKVCFIEQVPAKSVRPEGARLAGSDNARYFELVCREFGLQGRAAMLLAGTRETCGISWESLRNIADQSDALLNISGLLTDEALTARIPARVYLDLDPAFNQLWQHVQRIDMRFGSHTHHFTIGQNIGNADCPVPDCGINWLKTWQPVVLERWPVGGEIRRNALTTVANWRGYGSIDFNGVSYGQKVHSLRSFIALPTLTKERFELALAIHPNEKPDLEALSANRWQIVDPMQFANTPASYAEFIRGSKAEFGIAKSGYARSRCGWFSDRSVCYLASGRPVIAQDCGFAGLLPVGEGLLAFSTVNEVLSALDSMNSDYERHSRRAREIAVEFFDSDKVLGSLLRKVGL